MGSTNPFRLRVRVPKIGWTITSILTLSTVVVIAVVKEATLLGGALERMRIELKGVYRGLERHAADRTKELTTTNRELEIEIAERKLLSEENLVMAEIGKITSSELEMDQVYERLCEQAQRLVPFDRVTINFVDLSSGTVTIDYVSGIDLDDTSPNQTLPMEGSITAAALTDQSGELFQPSSIEDTARDYPGLIPNYEIGLKSFIAVPMVAKAAVAGVLLFQSAYPQAYSRRHLDLAVRLASQIASSVANARLYAQRQQAEEETGTIAEIGRIVSSSPDLGDVFDRFTDKLQTLIPFDWAFIHTVDQEMMVFSQSFLRGARLSSLRMGNDYPLAGSLSGKIVEARQGISLTIGNAQETAESLPTMQPLVSAGAQCVLGVPLISGGQVIAVMILASMAPNAYTQRDVELATRIAHQVTGAMASSKHFSQRQEAEKALQESEERFHQLVNQAVDPFFLAERYGKIVDVNERACAVLG